MNIVLSIAYFKEDGVFDLRKIFDLRKFFAVPKNFLKSKTHCTVLTHWNFELFSSSNHYLSAPRGARSVKRTGRTQGSHFCAFLH